MLRRTLRARLPRRVLRARLLAFAISAVVLVGCGGSDGPRATPAPASESAAPNKATAPSQTTAASPTTAATPSAAVSPSALPAVSLPPIPAPVPADAPLEARIEGSARTYYALLDRAVATGEVDALLDASVVECGCRSVVATIREAYEDGDSFVGYVTTISEIRNVRPDPEFFSDVQVVYSTSAYSKVDSDGTVLDTYEAEDYVVNVIVDDRRGYRVLKLEDALS